MKRVLIFIILLVISYTNTYAQQKVSDAGYIKDNEVLIENGKVTRNKTVFTITYKISFGKNVKSCNVKLYESYDEGKTFHPVSNAYVTGAGKVFSQGEKKILYDFSSVKSLLADKKLVYEVRVVTKQILENNLFALADISVAPILSYGAFVGYVRNFGGFIKARSSFSSAGYSYVIDKHGDKLDGNGKFWASDSYNKKYSHFNVSLGGIVRATKFLFPYLGLGVGGKNTYWEDVNYKWAKVDSYSYIGLSVDAGFVFKIGKIGILGGVSHIVGHEFLSFEVGVGVVL